MHIIDFFWKITFKKHEGDRMANNSINDSMNARAQGLVCCDVIVSCLSLMFCPSVERARVTLAPLPGVKGTDYINASYIMVQKQDFTVTLYIIFDHIY